MTPAPEIEPLPQAIRSEVMDLAGYRLTVHVLDDGRRVFEDTPEFRRLIAEMIAYEPHDAS